MGENIGELEDAIHGKIRDAGLRLTMPRRALSTVLASNAEEFFTTQEILSMIESIGVPIDPSTAYRALDDLSGIGLIHHVHLGNQPGRWHLTVDHDHQHLVCEQCGKTTLVPTSDFQPLFDRYERELGFLVNVHHFAILGHCETCESPPGHPHS